MGSNVLSSSKTLYHDAYNLSLPVNIVSIGLYAGNYDMATCYEESYCRSNESIPSNVHIGQKRAEHTRYKIILYEKGIIVANNSKLLQRISLLDLSGDVGLSSKEETGQTKHESNPVKGVALQKSQNKSKVTIDAHMTRSPFKRKNYDNNSEDDDMDKNCFKVWGKLTGSIDGICGKYKDTGENPTYGDVYLTIGGYSLRGKEAITRDGEYFLIMRKVPDHCSCLCSFKSHVDSSEHSTHPSYYEICGIVDKKVDFKERPSVVYQALDESVSEAYLYPSKNSKSKWLVFKVCDELLNDMTSENAYFKVVKAYRGKNETTKVVLCARNETFYIEKIELGGTILLVAPAGADSEEKGIKNVLTIVGSCKYMYNLIRATPIFDNLPKDEIISASLIADRAAISDSQIKNFLLNKYEEAPCYHIYQLDNKIRYMGEHFFGEFAVRVLQIIPIYFAQNTQNKRTIPELTILDFCDIVNKYSDVFEFIPSELKNVSTILQLLTRICDFHETFELENYIRVAEDETTALNLTAKLNLFKIQRLIAWCISTANHDVSMNFVDMVFHLDNIVFNDSLPCYVFDELLKYVMEYNGREGNVLDYVNCVKFYYDNISFSDLTEKVRSYCGIEIPIESNGGTLYDNTGPELFKIKHTVSPRIHNLEKLQCLNYDIFRLNTKGLAQLRFNYSMNSLLSICRSPLSLHISCLADKLVTVIEPDGCLLRICKTHEDEDLRDSLSALFKLRDMWHLEDLECKLKQFFREKTAIDAITGAPNHYARLWVKKEVNTKNIEGNKNNSIWEKDPNARKYAEEESYMIINWNVPLL